MGIDEWCAFEYEGSKMLTFEEIERQIEIDKEKENNSEK